MIGRLISHYKILEELGRGGMGVVYKAEDTKLKRTVALKFLPPELTRDPEAKARFIREAQAASALEHPNICNIHEINETEPAPGEPGGQLFIVMACYEGETLKQKLANGPLPFNQTVDIATQIAQGLEKAHEQGISHRDIKPANIIITTDGLVKILDFGLAKLAGQAQLTKDTSTLGTVAYMSPEQVGGKEVDQQTDIWSLGVVLYEMLTEELPFKGDYEQAVMYAILNENPPTITNLCEKLPKQIESIVNKCLEKDQIKRYDSIRKLADDLSKNQKEVLIEKHSTRSFYQFKNFPRSSKRTFNIAMAILLMSVLLTLFYKIFMTTNRSVVSHRKMIAVLPFENIGAQEDEYFTDGITEEITSRLAEIRELGVIARTSVMQYKNTEKVIQQIGKELGVEYIIGGTVRWEKPHEGESRIRVTPQLIRVSDATHLWTERYDKVLSNVFKIQSDIAERIVLALNITLLEKEKHLLKKKPTDNLKAYDYYLRGNNYKQRSYTKDDFQTAIKMYEKAIELDSNFTLAYANLSNLHTDMYWFSHDRSKERLLLAKKAIDKAVELNPDLPEVRLALGEYYYHGEREYKRALEQFSIALKYMPNNSDLLMNIGYVQRRQGKFEDALKNIKNATELNPKSQILILETATTYYYIRKYAEAERYYNQAISLAPDWPTPYHFKALLYLSWLGSTRKAQEVYEEALQRMSPLDFISKSQFNRERTLWRIISEEHIRLLKSISFHRFKSDPEKYFLIKAELHDRIKEPRIALTYYDSARHILEKKIRSLPEDDEYLTQLGIVYAGLGLKEKAIQAGRKAVENLPPSKDALDGAFNVQYLAQIYVMVGEYDAAIEQLELLQTLITSRVTIPWLKVDPTWDPLRDHPRFKKLLKEGK